MRSLTILPLAEASVARNGSKMENGTSAVAKVLLRFVRFVANTIQKYFFFNSRTNIKANIKKLATFSTKEACSRCRYSLTMPSASEKPDRI